MLFVHSFSDKKQERDLCADIIDLTEFFSPGDLPRVILPSFSSWNIITIWFSLLQQLVELVILCSVFNRFKILRCCAFCSIFNVHFVEYWFLARVMKCPIIAHTRALKTFSLLYCCVLCTLSRLWGVKTLTANRSNKAGGHTFISFSPWTPFTGNARHWTQGASVCEAGVTSLSCGPFTVKGSPIKGSHLWHVQPFG